jgi:hypothetical protein
MSRPAATLRQLRSPLAQLRSMRSKTSILLVALVCGTGLACVGSLHAGPVLPARFKLAMGTLTLLTATPGAISFQAVNPDVGMVSGSSPGNITWMVLIGSHLQNWTMSLQAGSNSFVGCPSIPISAVRVSCSTATVSGGGGTGGCSGSFPLSSTPQQIAGGAEGDGANLYSVFINFTLAESWRYVANSACTLTITYSVNAP